jgi:tetratricopeptide (TPR) repeat protein
MKRIGTYLAAFLAMLTVSCASMDLKNATKYEEHGDWEKAIAYYEKVALKKPSDPEVQEAFAQAKNRYAQKIIEDTVQRCATGPKTVRLVSECIDEAERAVKMSDRCKEAQWYLIGWKEEKQAKIKQLAQLVQKRNIFLAQNKWDKALEVMDGAYALHPDDPQYAQAIQDIKSQAYTDCWDVSQKLFAKEDYRHAYEAIEKALKYEKMPEAIDFLKRITNAIEAEKKYPAAKTFVRERKYSKALSLLAEIRRLNPDKLDVTQDLVTCHYHIGLNDEAAGRLSHAINHFGKVIELNSQHSEALQHLQKNREIFLHICSNQIKQFQENNLPGNVYLFLSVLSNHQFDRVGPDLISSLRSQTEQEILQHAVPKIAVLDFQKKMYKSSSLDLARLIPDIVYELLQLQRSQPFELIDRSLAVNQLDNAGIYIGRQIDEGKIRSISDLLSTTLLVFGEIIDFNFSHDKSVKNHKKRYVSGYHEERNPQYDYYLEKLRAYNECKRSKEEGKYCPYPLPVSKPRSTIKVDDYSSCYYTEEMHMLNASMQVRYKVYDAISQNFLFDQEIPSRETHKDWLVQGCEEAGVSYDPLELPTQEEITYELVYGNVYTFMRQFDQVIANIPDSYFVRSKQHVAASNFTAAVEDYVTACLLAPDRPEINSKFDALVSQITAAIIPGSSYPYEKKSIWVTVDAGEDSSMDIRLKKAPPTKPKTLIRTVPPKKPEEVTTTDLKKGRTYTEKVQIYLQDFPIQYIRHGRNLSQKLNLFFRAAEITSPRLQTAIKYKLKEKWLDWQHLDPGGYQGDHYNQDLLKELKEITIKILHPGSSWPYEKKSMWVTLDAGEDKSPDMRLKKVPPKKPEEVTAADLKKAKTYIDKVNLYIQMVGATHLRKDWIHSERKRLWDDVKHTQYQGWGTEKYNKDLLDFLRKQDNRWLKWDATRKKGITHHSVTQGLMRDLGISKSEAGMKISRLTKPEWAKKLSKKDLESLKRHKAGEFLRSLDRIPVVEGF